MIPSISLFVVPLSCQFLIQNNNNKSLKNRIDGKGAAGEHQEGRQH
jgi:hypothetical protein